MTKKQFTIEEQDLRKAHELCHTLYRFLVLNEVCCDWPPEREKEIRTGLIHSQLAELSSIITRIDPEFTWALLKEWQKEWEWAKGAQKTHVANARQNLKLVQAEKEIPSNEGGLVEGE
jgi:hypothetical protein